MEKKKEQRPEAEAFAEQCQELVEEYLALEALTLQMLECAEEMLPEKVEERRQMMEKIDKLWAECGGQDAKMRQVMLQAAGVEAQMRAAVCRIQELDVQVVERLKAAQAHILKQIRIVGRSTGAQASLYYREAPRDSAFYGRV